MRLLRKVQPAEQGPKETRVFRTDLSAVAAELANATGEAPEAFTPMGIAARLRAVMTPWVNEGFFADVAVVVEGEDDRAALIGTASSKGHDLETRGISVLPCCGKNNLDKLAVIFRQLQVPTYVVWDSDDGDKEAKPEENRRLLRLFGHPEEDWPEKVTPTFACFKRDLESTMRQEIGQDVFDQSLDKCRKEYGIPKKKHALKNPSVIERIIQLAADQGSEAATLNQIIEHVIRLKSEAHRDTAPLDTAPARG